VKGGDQVKLLVFILNDEDKLDELLQSFISNGISGATVIDSMGMARILTSHSNEDIPIIGSLKLMISGGRPYNKTIFVALKDEQVNSCISAIKEVVGSLEGPDSGILFTVPIDYIEGFY
jgi:hypothetical protein